MKGINIFGIEIKSCLLADDTTLFNADLGSLKKNTEDNGPFWETSGSFLKREENKGDLVRKMDE